MAYRIWCLVGDEMTILQEIWESRREAGEVATGKTCETNIVHIAIESGSEIEQLLLDEKERKEHPSPVTAKPESILSLIEILEESYQQGKITFEECSQQQQRWYRLFAQVDER